MTGDALVLCCPDKFRGSITAQEAAGAFALGVERAGRTAVGLPLADGGEGTLDVLCPAASDRHSARVTGPLGARTDAEWGVRGETAVVEDGPCERPHARGRSQRPVARDDVRHGRADPCRARFRRAARDRRGRRLRYGRRWAGRARGPRVRPPWGRIVVACDVSTTFVDAARVFGPQKERTTMRLRSSNGGSSSSPSGTARRTGSTSARSRLRRRGRPRRRARGDRREARPGAGARRGRGRAPAGARGGGARHDR